MPARGSPTSAVGLHAIRARAAMSSTARPRDLNTVVAVGAGRRVAGAARLRGEYAYYFLWSLERVAVAYGLETIGNHDWYAWGARALLATQEKDGGWRASQMSMRPASPWYSIANWRHPHWLSKRSNAFV